MPLYSATSKNAIQKTLGAQLLSGSTTSATLSDTTGIPNLPGVMVIDRVDSNGVETPNKREYIAYTGTSGSTVTGLTRNVDSGSTDQDHAVGAIVEFIPDVTWAGAIYTALSNVVNTTTLALDTTKVLSPAGLQSTATLANKWVSNATVTGFVNFSGASITGLSTTGGFNALFQVPGVLATTSTDAMGTIPVPTSYTLQFMTAYLRTPSTGASLSITVKKYPSTTVGVISMLAGATFASSASFASTSIVAGDLLIADINTNNLGADLSLLIRGQ